jgi:tetratricopeptide (TPR) repeat protein
MRSPLSALAVLSLVLGATDSRAAPPDRPSRVLSLVALDSEPREGVRTLTAEELLRLGRDVDEHPDDRARRLSLVRGLLGAKDLDGALAQAKAWRAKDAYNLVAVRALGDVYMERGAKADAERVYSSIVELLPRDPDAERAVATLLKQRGDLAAARARLLAAVDERPNDARLVFELADVELRLGQTSSATTRLETVIAAQETPAQIRYPAKQRLGQILGEARRDAQARGQDARAKELTGRIDALDLQGGLENDLHVFLTWDTDRTDVDLWVTTPHGEKIYYSHRLGADGEALFDDVTTGYGPESFTANDAQPGEYLVQVNYFSAHRGPFPEARGEVVVVLNEGRKGESKHILPYRLFAESQTVNVATIRIGGGK